MSSVKYSSTSNIYSHSLILIYVCGSHIIGATATKGKGGRGKKQRGGNNVKLLSQTTVIRGLPHVSQATFTSYAPIYTFVLFYPTPL
jgi:hypothetical protein